jgi:cytochrome c553
MSKFKLALVRLMEKNVKEVLKNSLCVLTLGVAALFGIGALAPSGDLPPWAYPVNPPGYRRTSGDDTIEHVPGSAETFTLMQVQDLYNVPDWHPSEHPPMPESVSHGRRPGAFACGYCHLPTGLGRPENSSVAGLPAAYIIQQMADFKSGARKCSEPRMGPPANMIAVAKAATDAEVAAAAEYFATLKLKPWIRVVETDTVPKTEVSGNMLVASKAGGTEPIGRRIIETPEAPEREELRDTDSGFVAYIPVGSIERGERLVTTGGATVVAGRIVPGPTIQCGTCHGPDLKGLGNVPALAGRSPSYIVRQLYDMQHGARSGPGAELMKATVAQLSVDDMVSIAAYLASRVP